MPPSPDVDELTDTLANELNEMPPAVPKLFMDIVPPLPVPTAFAVIAAVVPVPPPPTLNTLVVFIVRVIVPPEPEVTPLAESPPVTAINPEPVTPAVKTMFGPRPELCVVERLAEVIVKLPAVKTEIFVGVVELVPPVAEMAKAPLPEPIVRGAACPVVVKLTVPPVIAEAPELTERV